jgi:hypothetical protein
MDLTYGMLPLNLGVSYVLFFSVFGFQQVTVLEMCMLTSSRRDVSVVDWGWGGLFPGQEL